MSIAVNICKNTNQNNLDEEIPAVDEETRLKIHEDCSIKAIELMELNVRNTNCRNLLKKALNIYCEFINPHIMSLVEKNKSFVEDEDSTEFKWKQLLYRIVISIVRILRGDFENPQNQVDIELVIYFYELLKVIFQVFKFRINKAEFFYLKFFF